MGAKKIVTKTEEIKEEVKTAAEAKTNSVLGYKRVEKTRGKKYVESRKRYDHAKLFPINEALDLLQKVNFAKFNSTVELHLVLKKTGISAQVNLPFQAGKVKKVEIADDSTIAKLKDGTIDFDILVATADMMPKLVAFARLLGPRGLMPNPKNGTLVTDIKKAKEYSASSVVIKTEKEAPLVHTVIGKINQDKKELIANYSAITDALGGSKQIIKAYIKSTMSPSIKILI